MVGVEMDVVARKCRFDDAISDDVVATNDKIRAAYIATTHAKQPAT